MAYLLTDIKQIDKQGNSRSVLRDTSETSPVGNIERSYFLIDVSTGGFAYVTGKGFTNFSTWSPVFRICVLVLYNTETGKTITMKSDEFIKAKLLKSLLAYKRLKQEDLSHDSLNHLLDIHTIENYVAVKAITREGYLLSQYLEPIGVDFNEQSYFRDKDVIDSKLLLSVNSHGDFINIPAVAYDRRELKDRGEVFIGDYILYAFLAFPQNNQIFRIEGDELHIFSGQSNIFYRYKIIDKRRFIQLLSMIRTSWR